MRKFLFIIALAIFIAWLVYLPAQASTTTVYLQRANAGVPTTNAVPGVLTTTAGAVTVYDNFPAANFPSIYTYDYFNYFYGDGSGLGPPPAANVISYVMGGFTGSLDGSKQPSDLNLYLYWENMTGGSLWAEMEVQVIFLFNGTAGGPTLTLTYDRHDWPSVSGYSAGNPVKYNQSSPRVESANGYVNGQSMINGKVLLNLFNTGGDEQGRIKVDAPLVGTPSYIVIPYGASSSEVSTAISPNVAPLNSPAVLTYSILNNPGGLGSVAAVNITVPGGITLPGGNFYSINSANSVKGTASILQAADSSHDGVVQVVYDGVNNLSVTAQDTVTISVNTPTSLFIPPDASWRSIFKYSGGLFTDTSEVYPGSTDVRVVGLSSATDSITTSFSPPYDHKITTGSLGQTLTYTITNSPSSPEMLASAIVTIPGGVAGEFFSGITITGTSANVSVTSMIYPSASLPGSISLLFPGGLTATAGSSSATVSLLVSGPTGVTTTTWTTLFSTVAYQYLTATGGTNEQINAVTPPTATASISPTQLDIGQNSIKLIYSIDMVSAPKAVTQVAVTVPSSFTVTGVTSHLATLVTTPVASGGTITLGYAGLTAGQWDYLTITANTGSSYSVDNWSAVMANPDLVQVPLGGSTSTWTFQLPPEGFVSPSTMVPGQAASPYLFQMINGGTSGQDDAYMKTVITIPAAISVTGVTGPTGTKTWISSWTPGYNTITLTANTGQGLDTPDFEDITITASTSISGQMYCGFSAVGAYGGTSTAVATFGHSLTVTSLTLSALGIITPRVVDVGQTRTFVYTFTNTGGGAPLGDDIQSAQFTFPAGWAIVSASGVTVSPATGVKTWNAPVVVGLTVTMTAQGSANYLGNAESVSVSVVVTAPLAAATPVAISANLTGRVIPSATPVEAVPGNGDMKVKAAAVSSQGFITPNTALVSQSRSFLLTFSDTGSGTTGDNLTSFLISLPPNYTITAVNPVLASADSWTIASNSSSVTLTATGNGIPPNGYVYVTITATTPAASSSGLYTSWGVRTTGQAGATNAVTGWQPNDLGVRVSPFGSQGWVIPPAVDINQTQYFTATFSNTGGANADNINSYIFSVPAGFTIMGAVNMTATSTSGPWSSYYNGSGQDITLTAIGAPSIPNMGSVSLGITLTAQATAAPFNWTALAVSAFSADGSTPVSGLGAVGIENLSAIASVAPQNLGLNLYSVLAYTITNTGGAGGDTINNVFISLPPGYPASGMQVTNITDSRSGTSWLGPVGGFSSLTVSASAPASALSNGDILTVYLGVTASAASAAPALWPVNVTGSLGGTVAANPLSPGSMSVGVFDPPLVEAVLTVPGGGNTILCNQTGTQLDYQIRNMSDTAKTTEPLQSVVINVPSNFTNISAVSLTGSASVNGNVLTITYGPGALTPTGTDLVSIYSDIGTVVSSTNYYFSVTATTTAYGLSDNEMPLFGSLTITALTAAQAPTRALALVLPNAVGVSRTATFAYALNNLGLPGPSGVSITAAHIFVPHDYQFQATNIAAFPVTTAAISVPSNGDNGKTKRVDITFANGGLPISQTCIFTFTNITTPATAQSLTWTATVDTGTVSGINSSPASADALTVYVVGPPQFTAKILQTVNATLNSTATILYQVKNPAASRDTLTGVNIAIPSGWTALSARTDSGTVTVPGGGGSVIIGGLTVTSTLTQDAYVNVTIQATSPASGTVFTFNARVNTGLYPAANTLIINAGSSDVQITLTTPVASMAVNKNFINPLHGDLATVTYSVAADADVYVCLYSVHGDLVKVLDKGHKAMGTYMVTWDGKASGSNVASGVYIIFVQVGSFKDNRKLIVIK